MGPALLRLQPPLARIVTQPADGDPAEVVGWVAGFLLPLPVLFFAGSVSSGLEDLAAIALLIGTLLFTSAVLLFASPLMLLSFLLGLIFWQNAGLGFGARIWDAEVGVIPVAISTLLIYAVAGLQWTAQKTHLKLLGAPAAAMLAGLATSGLTMDLTPLVAYVRNFTICAAILYIAASVARHRWLEARRWLLFVVRTIVGLLLFGAAAQLVMGSGPWLGFFGMDRLTHLGGVPESTTVFGVRLPRIGSFVIDPINMSFVAAGCAAVSAAIERRLTLTAIGGAVLVVLAAGKGAAMFLGICAILALMPRTRAYITRKPGRAITGLIVAVVALGTGYIAAVLGSGAARQLFLAPETILGQGESTTYHISAFVAAFTQALSHPLGHGLGVGGNFASADSDVHLAVTGGESGLGVLIYQLGWIGLFGFLWAVARILKRLEDPPLHGGAVLLAAWLSSTVLQEQPMGPMSASLILLGVGFFLGNAWGPDEDERAGGRHSYRPSGRSFA